MWVVEHLSPLLFFKLVMISPELAAPNLSTSMGDKRAAALLMQRPTLFFLSTCERSALNGRHDAARTESVFVCRETESRQCFLRVTFSRNYDLWLSPCSVFHLDSSFFLLLPPVS